MARADARSPRLHVSAPLDEGTAVALSPGQTNYLVNVLRLAPGARVLVFNGDDGEFAASLAATGRKGLALALGARTRPPEAPPDLDLLFAPIKHTRLDYLAQKAVEMGARRLRPVMTRRAQIARLHLERLQANAIEAAEQCGAVWTPQVLKLQPLEAALTEWPARRLLVFCDEDAPRGGPLEILSGA